MAKVSVATYLADPAIVPVPVPAIDWILKAKLIADERPHGTDVKAALVEGCLAALMSDDLTEIRTAALAALLQDDFTLHGALGLARARQIAQR